MSSTFTLEVGRELHFKGCRGLAQNSRGVLGLKKGREDEFPDQHPTDILSQCMVQVKVINT